MSADDVAGELRSGMTVGIGGWGSRRKPMALVRAILRSGLRDLEIVSYGGPDVGLLIAGGHVRRVVCGFVSLDTIALEPHFRRARQQGTVGLTELDEGMLHWGLLAAAHRLPFLPIRAGLGSDVQRVNPRAAHGPLPLRRRRGTDRHARAAARRRADPPEPRGRRRQRPVPGAGPVLRRPVLPGGRARLSVLRADRADREPAGVRAAAEPAGQPGHGGRRGGGARRRPLHQLRAGLRPRRGVPGPLRGGGRRPGGLAAVPGRVPGRRRGQLPASRAAVR